MYNLQKKKFGYRLADLQNQSRTSNLDNEHFPRDASNHANVEEVAGPPYEDLSNGLYLRQQTLYSGQTQFQVENNTEGMETQMNTCMLFSSSKIYFIYQFRKGTINYLIYLVQISQVVYPQSTQI
jgi:hypothetical protein